MVSVLLGALPARAHKGSDAYWTLKATGSHFTGRLDVALKDLALLLPLDPNGDGALTWGELSAQRPALCTLVQQKVSLAQVGARCVLDCGALQVVTHSDGTYAALELSGSCPADLVTVQATYELLFDVDAQHRGLLSLGAADSAHWDAFTSNQRTRDVTFAAVSAGEQAGLAVIQGLHHIGVGWDHLCFLFALLLPSVLRRDARTWVTREAFKPAFLDVAKVVTAFTVAHSVTLALAAFEVVHPNAKWVEVAIAASVALAALNNLWPFVPETRWSLAFSLGLMHGFGFVSAIQDLGASGPRLWLSVFSFNVGVELGQLLIVTALVPLLWLLRGRALYARVILPLGSAVILGVALFWVSQRV
ncbi:MAG: HupE/UreJ family protein [Myxococcaceae bacterium]